MIGKFLNNLARRKDQKEIAAILGIYCDLLLKLLSARDAGDLSWEEAKEEGGRLGLLVAAITIQKLSPNTPKQRLMANDLEAWFGASSGLSNVNVLQTINSLMSYAYGGGGFPVVEKHIDVLDSSLLTECPNFPKFEGLARRLTAG